MSDPMPFDEWFGLFLGALRAAGLPTQKRLAYFTTYLQDARDCHEQGMTPQEAARSELLAYHEIERIEEGYGLPVG